MQSQFSRSGRPVAPPRPAALRRAGHRFGYGAASVLPPLDEEGRARPRPSPAPVEHPGSETAHPHERGLDSVIVPRTIGKYLVSPLIKVLDNGWFAGSVSIRSGSGSTTSDRILRLTRLFRSLTEAASFAHAEGLQWISVSGRPSTA